MRASLFLTTYEMPRHLELVLAGVERQSESDFELFLCDDGSGEETRAVVDSFRERSGIATTHIWQENRGFRKCRILNAALRQARGEICVFLDGDCIPHSDYLKDHVQESRPGTYRCGRRVELGEKLSAALTPDSIRAGALDPLSALAWRSALAGELAKPQRLIRVPWAPLRRALGMDRVDDLKGCNYSVARADLLAINGFDEEYEGYGREDTDVEIRLQNLGLRIQSLKGLALQYHVWHPRRVFTPANDSRLESARRERRVRCERGIVTTGSLASACGN